MKLLDYHRLRDEERAGWNLLAIETAVGMEFAGRVTDLLPSKGERFAGDLKTVDRGPLYRKLEMLSRLYRNGSEDQRLCIRSHVRDGAPSLFESFGLRAAVVAIREHSVEAVRTGLAAFAIADIPGDVRETLMSLSVMFHAAEQVSGDGARLFREAASISGPATAAVLTDFANRPAGLRALAMMGWRRVETADGPGFEWGWPKPVKPDRAP